MQVIDWLPTFPCFVLEIKTGFIFAHRTENTESSLT